MKPIIKALNKCAFDIQFDYNADSVTYQEKTGAYLFWFTVNYERHYKSILLSTYLNPGEFDVHFEILGIDDLAVYNYKNELLDLTYKKIEQLTELILKKL